MDFDIEKDLSIDKSCLDSEAVSYPSVYFHYADACSQAKLEMSDMSDKLKAGLALRQIAIREQCATDGKKVTEAVITAMLDTDAEAQELRAKYRESEATYAKLSVAVAALETKKYSLDNLVKLYAAGYFSGVGTGTTNPGSKYAQTVQDFHQQINS